MSGTFSGERVNGGWQQLGRYDCEIYASGRHESGALTGRRPVRGRGSHDGTARNVGRTPGAVGSSAPSVRHELQPRTSHVLVRETDGRTNGRTGDSFSLLTVK